MTTVEKVTNTDDLGEVTLNKIVVRGSTTNVSIPYSASTARDISVDFRMMSSPYTTYQTSVVRVSAGSGTIQVPMAIPSNVPIANTAYRYRIFLLPAGQRGYINRVDELYVNKISITGNAGTNLTASLDFLTLSEKDQVKTVSVFPNPANNIVNVMLPAVTDYSAYSVLQFKWRFS